MKLLVILITLIGALAANANRITPDNMIRCKINLTPQKCEKQRDLALSRGCISAEEHATLKANGGMPTCYVEDNSLAGWCPCGCFAQGTLLKTSDSGFELIESIVGSFARGQRPMVSHLSDESSLSQVRLKTSDIRNVSVGKEKLPLYLIETTYESKRNQISLTRNHPVVLGDGKITSAANLIEGQELLNSHGAKEKIVRITRNKYNGLVYNLSVDSQKDSEHFLIANGLVMGDLYLQGNLSYFQNQILIRK